MQNAAARDKRSAPRGPNHLTVLLVFVLLPIAQPFLLSPGPAGAQELLGLDPTGRSADAPSPPFEEEAPEKRPEFVLPSIPSPPEAGRHALPGINVYISEIIVEGSTVFSQEQLAEITSPYVHREITNEDLEDLRQALTRFYIQHGYVTSGAVIPDQAITDGRLRVRIIEGGLSEITIEGNRWFRAGYLRSQMEPAREKPVNTRPLQYRLRLLQMDPLIRRVNAELRPGVRPGESTLNVKVSEENPFEMHIGFNNYLSPSVGAERLMLALAHQNLMGRGDVLRLSYGKSDGLDPQMDLFYSLPINAHRTTLSARYRKNDFSVVEEPFENLEIESESEIYEITLKHPVYRTLEQEFALAVTAEHLHNRTRMMGVPFAFTPGTENGESTVTALRFSQEWTYRTQRQVMAARSRFSFGVDALGATTWDEPLPDGTFTSWLGQFQYVRLLEPYDIQIIFKTDMQFANDPLLPLEQMAVGGRYSVRGYRENSFVRDQGFVASLELRIPLFRDVSWADYLQLAPFFDLGASRNRESPSPPPNTIYSTGLGLRWAWTLMEKPFQIRPQLEFYWGIPLRDVPTGDHDDLQDKGIHFQFVITGF